MLRGSYPSDTTVKADTSIAKIVGGYIINSLVDKRDHFIKRYTLCIYVCTYIFLQMQMNVWFSVSIDARGQLRVLLLGSSSSPICLLRHHLLVAWNSTRLVSQ